MIIDFSTHLSSALSYLGKGLNVFPLRHRDKKPVAGFSWEPFQNKLPTRDQVNSFFRGNDVNIAIATAASLIHRHATALQMSWRKREE
jgi:hypothetical protein